MQRFVLQNSALLQALREDLLESVAFLKLCTYESLYASICTYEAFRYGLRNVLLIRPLRRGQEKKIFRKRGFEKISTV